MDPQGRDLTQVHRSNVGQIVQNLSTSLCWQVSKQVKISFSHKCYNWSCANFKNTTNKKKSLFSVIHGRNVFLSIECHGVVKVSWLFFGKVVILAYFLGWYLFKDDCTYTGFGIFFGGFCYLNKTFVYFVKESCHFQHKLRTINFFSVFLHKTCEKKRIFAYLPLVEHKTDINMHKRWSWHHQIGTKIRLGWITVPCVKKIMSSHFHPSPIYSIWYKYSIYNRERESKKKYFFLI